MTMSEKQFALVDSELRFSSAGVHIAIEADPGIADIIRESLPPDSRPSSRRPVDRCYRILSDGDASSGASGTRFSLYADSALLGNDLSLSDLLGLFENDSRLFVAEVSKERVILHAGVVGWRGKAIVLPGPSWSGKTTLVAALVAAGASYLSDEYAVLDPRKRVHPYLKPLSIRQEGRQARICTVEELGGQPSLEPLEVGLVLVTSYHPEETWRPTKLSPAEGLLELAKNSVSIRRSPGLVLQVLSKVVVAAPVLCGPRGEGQQVVSYLRERDADFG
jgi:hypothetical protein